MTGLPTTNSIERSTSSIHIKWTRHDRAELRRCWCPNCNRNMFFATFHEEYYGWDDMCLKCGDRWQDNEMLERPFARGWRAKSIEAAKKHYHRMKGIL